MLESALHFLSLSSWNFVEKFFRSVTVNNMLCNSPQGASYPTKSPGCRGMRTLVKAKTFQLIENFEKRASPLSGGLIGWANFSL